MWWANLRLTRHYFPLTLMQGKYASEPSSYRPICLLPSLGKLLEKLLVFWLYHFLESNNILHHKQYGFREDRSCHNILFAILTSCARGIGEGNYTTIVSSDIKDAFDNVDCWDILLQLREIGCPSNIVGTIATYLKFRSILISWVQVYQCTRQGKDCPQGSCLGPVLWLLIANVLLKELQKLGFILRIRGWFQLCFFRAAVVWISSCRRWELSLHFASC